MNSRKRRTHFTSLALSQMALRRNDVAAAEKYANEAAAADASLPNAHAALGFIAIAEERFRSSPQRVEGRRGNRAPSLELSGFCIVIISRKQERRTTAVAYLTGLTKRVQDYFPYWTSLGRLALAGKRYDEALADLERVLAQDADNPDALDAPGADFSCKGRHQEIHRATGTTPPNLPRRSRG